jgi:hypothetical protein
MARASRWLSCGSRCAFMCYMQGDGMYITNMSFASTRTASYSGNYTASAFVNSSNILFNPFFLLQCLGNTECREEVPSNGVLRFQESKLGIASVEDHTSLISPCLGHAELHTGSLMTRLVCWLERQMRGSPRPCFWSLSAIARMRKVFEKVA